MNAIARLWADAFARVWEHRYITGAVGLVVTLLQQAFGGIAPRALGTLAFFIGVDFLMGLGIAWWTKTAESRQIYRLPKKLTMYGVTLIVINLLVKSDPAWAGTGGSLLTGILGIMTTGEAISILEKLAEISKRTGIEIPVIGVLLNRLKVKQQGTLPQ